MSDWAELADNLAEELSDMPESACVVISEIAPTGDARFAQFTKLEKVLVAELTGDRYLSPESRPDDAGWRAITRAGWHVPDPDHVDNWWFEFDSPIRMPDYRRAAQMAVTGLRDGFGIAAPADLGYKGWVERTGNSRLLLISLGLRETD